MLLSGVNTLSEIQSTKDREKTLPVSESQPNTRADKDRLVSGRWLNCSIINAVQRLLREKFPSQEGLQDTATLESSCKPLHGKFVHVGQCHWLTASNKWCPPSSVKIYDSLNGLPTADTKSQLAAIMHCEEPVLLLQVMDVEPQINGDDCGLHAAAAAYELCVGDDPTGIKWKPKELRAHLKQSLQTQKMQSFPRTGLRPSGIVRNSVAVPLHCICRMPEKRSAKMAKCSKCTCFTRHVCAFLRPFFSKKREQWTCSTC